MWLPREERRLLEIYYWAICEGLKKVGSSPFTEKWYSKEDLINAFQTNCFHFKKMARMDKDDYHKSVNKMDDTSSEESEDIDVPKLKRDIRKCLTTIAKIDSANASLSERGMIRLKTHESQDRIGVGLTIAGYDLGRKYSLWFTRTGEWFKEYREHWVWLIVGFLGGILGSLIIDGLK